MDKADKNAISHRYRALDALRSYLQDNAAQFAEDASAALANKRQKPSPP